MDWNKLEVEYITTNTSYAKLAAKYHTSARTISEYARRHEWKEKRRKYVSDTVGKAVERVSKLESIDLSKEIGIVHNLSNIMSDALLDPKQFNRYLVEETEYNSDGFPKSKKTVEKKFKRVDFKQVKDAANALQAIEKMRRSMETILTFQEKENLKNAKKRIRLEERKVKLLEAEAENKNISVEEAESIVLVNLSDEEVAEVEE
ncbi:hypothetical protein [Mogibacterium diversum]